MSRLEGKRAIISGAATGIGAATARRFVAEGAAVAIIDVNEADGQALVAELGAAGAAHFLPCDVGDVSVVQRAVERAAELLGGIDIVFANAGVGTIVVGGTVESIDPERWDLAFNVNARGVYALCRAALPYLRASGKGSIIMTSSASAFTSGERRPSHAYAATKGALISLVHAMAVSYGPEGIRVNALVPGLIRTRLTDDIAAQPGRLQAAIDAIPLRRAGTPDDMASCVLFLASDESSFVTGTFLVADGGQTAT
jgi:meso-butanediol dehydrogenase/(S,S)-butanediol dehydrogenase/diacetyl reductase